ncbi:MAG: DoxX family protein [Flavobacteriaceae bacterium]|jgi:hypothetical protein
MKYLKYVLMGIIATTVLNVWLLRFNKPTIYRGGQAKSMLEEFAAYGLSETFVYLIGGLKVVAALGLIGGFFYKKLIVPSSLVIAVLMVGAIFMHFKVQDTAIKFLPATLMLLCSLGVLYLVNQRSVES